MPGDKEVIPVFSDTDLGVDMMTVTTQDGTRASRICCSDGHGTWAPRRGDGLWKRPVDGAPGRGTMKRWERARMDMVFKCELGDDFDEEPEVLDETEVYPYEH